MDCGPRIDLYLRHCMEDLMGGDYGTDYDPVTEDPPLNELLRPDGLAHFQEHDVVTAYHPRQDNMYKQDPVGRPYKTVASPYHRAREEMHGKKTQTVSPELW